MNTSTKYRILFDSKRHLQDDWDLHYFVPQNVDAHLLIMLFLLKALTELIAHVLQQGFLLPNSRNARNHTGFFSICFINLYKYFFFKNGR